ncbi:uncharacterized protein IWZ02DRAFT_436163 [Phyllosticta citriasiana]|uniref:uncharacterized protein n=1 Tax=Phyllosticta citriasiana TaxID=595635 RepID=UPI0030FD4DE9
MTFHFGTGRSVFFTINHGRIHYRNQRRMEQRLTYQDPTIEYDAIAIRDTTLPLSMRLAAWDRWKAHDAGVLADWNSAGRPPCAWCLRVHVPPHISREQVELRHETRWEGRRLEGGRAPCRRCACQHGGACRTPQCHFCGNYHWGSVPCERATRRRMAAGFAPVDVSPPQRQQQHLQNDAEEERRLETMSFEAMRNTVNAMNASPLDFATMAKYWNSFLRKGEIDPYNVRSVVSGAMKALVHGANPPTTTTTTAAMALYLAPFLSELSQEHPSRFQSVVAEMMSAFVHGAVASLRDLSNIARLVDSMASYLAQNTSAKRRMDVDEGRDGYGGRNKRMRAYEDDDVS